jgi:hypothetical protein
LCQEDVKLRGRPWPRVGGRCTAGLVDRSKSDSMALTWGYAAFRSGGRRLAWSRSVSCSSMGPTQSDRASLGRYGPNAAGPSCRGTGLDSAGRLARSASGRGAVTKVGGRSRRNGRPTGELISALGISESCSSQRSTDRRPTRTPRLGSLRPAPYKSNKRRWDPRCSAPRSQSQETRVRRHERHHRASRDRRIRPASGGPPRRGPYLSNR